jgi:hypothetical protein
MPRMRWHYTPCDGGGSGGGRAVFALVVIAALALAAAAIAGPAHKAATGAAHVLAAVLEVVALTLATVAGLAVTAILVAVAVRVWRWPQARAARQQHELAVRAVPVQAPSWPHRPALSADRPAIEAPKRTVPGVVLRSGKGASRDRS